MNEQGTGRMDRKGRTRNIVALIIVLAASLTATSVSGRFALAQPGADIAQLERAQEPLLRITDELQRVVDGLGDSGFSNLSISPETGSITLFWRGDTPPVVNSLISRAQREQIKFDVRSAHYSRSELNAKIDSILKSIAPGQITAVEANVDGSGLVVGVSPRPEGSRSPADSVRSRMDALRGTSTVGKSNIPIELREGPDIRPAIGRYNDTIPFYGGAAYYNLTERLICSTAFGARTFGGSSRMMTAAHCNNDRNPPADDAYTYNPFTNTYGPTYVGPFDRSDEFNDVAAISAPSGAAIYTGGIDPYFQVSTVLNWGANPNGMIVRASAHSQVNTQGLG